MKILIDTNVILDFLLQREPFLPDADRLFQAISDGQVVGYVTATTLTDIFYVARRHTQSLEKARQAISGILTAMEVCPVDRHIAELALNSNCPDFEDAIQISSAVTQELDAIVTRDLVDFTSSSIPVYSPADLLDQLPNP